MAAQDEELDVIIVGARFTGLAAAAELSKLGASFIVLDAYADHLGGRAYSYDAPVPSGSPLRFDHGAQYVGDAQNAIMDIVREKLPPGSLVHGANLRLSHPYEVMVLAQKRDCFRSDKVLNENNDDAGGPRPDWLRCGADQVAEATAEPFRDRIRQGVRVSEIEHGEGGVLVRTSTGEELRAKRVLVAVSPSTAGRIRYVPELDAAHKALMAQPMGKTIECQLYDRTPRWHRSKGFDYDGSVGGANHPVLWVMDNSPPEADALESHVHNDLHGGRPGRRARPQPERRGDHGAGHGCPQHAPRRRPRPARKGRALEGRDAPLASVGPLRGRRV
jgi:monoamine oxidase